jgi:TPR repeat protein
MKLSSVLVVFGLCLWTVSAETTLELIQQRAEAGDVQAQTFLGMAYFYGCNVAADPAKAQTWFTKAAEQGDEFAAKRRDLFGQTVRTTVRTSTDLRSVPAEELQKKIEQAGSAPYEGTVNFDELAINRNQYVGKVIELRFTTLTVVGGPSDGNPYIYVRDPRSYGSQGGSSDRLYLCGEEALKWKLDVDKKSPGIASTICALVEKEGLIALGVRKRKTDSGYTYSW